MQVIVVLLSNVLTIRERERETHTHTQTDRQTEGAREIQRPDIVSLQILKHQ